MRSSAKRILCLLAIATLLTAGLSACAPEAATETTADKTTEEVGEDEAKQAGLDLINLAFDAGATDAVIEYSERAGTSYVGGEEVQTGDEEPVRLYCVTVLDQNGDPAYYAEVNAETGRADYAKMSRSLVELTPKQSKQAAAIGSMGDFSNMDFSQERQDAAQFAQKWVLERFKPDAPVLCSVTNNAFTDSEQFPLIDLDGYVVLRDGTIYTVTVCWPAMEVVEAGTLGEGE